MDEFDAEPQSVSRAVVLGCALGTLFGLAAIWLAIASGGAGHGDYGFARALFPATMLLTLVEGRIGQIGIAIALLQFPAYGGLVGWASARGRHLPVLVVALAHLAAAVACFSGVIPNFS